MDSRLERAAREGACRVCVSNEYDTADQAEARYERDLWLAVQRAVEGA